MDPTTLKVHAAGLMHDLGKAGTRATLGVDGEYIRHHENVYLPVRNGRYSHHHAIYSAAIIEKNADLFPLEFTSREWGEGDTFINLIAGHHNPSTPLQWVIAVADRISSGWDRDTFEKEEDEITVKDFLETRLFTLFEQLLAEEDKYDSADNFQYHYRLAGMTAKNLFPVQRSNQEDKGSKSLTQEYEDLYNQFLASLSQLLHRNENVELWLEHFDSLMMVYMSAIPAARVGKVVPDVSLYDHCRVTAALATALYLYHKENNSLNENSIKDYDTEKFLIVSGDLYGIQDFIFKGYGDTRKHRSKLLRGRSLYVSLLSELAADMLCRRIGLHRMSSILNAAGKFLIIAPNTEKAWNAVNEVDRDVNDWLYDVSLGETALGITVVTAKPRDFVERTFQKLWDRISFQTEKKKFSKIDLDRHGGAVQDYLDRFNNDLQSPICPICGKRPSNDVVEGSPYIDQETMSACKLCRDHIFLGTKIVKNKHIALLRKDAPCSSLSNYLVEPIYNVYQVAFLDSNVDSLAQNRELLGYWDIQSWARDSIASKATVKMLNGYVPVYMEEDRYDERILCSEKLEKKKLDAIDQINVGEPKTFTHIAAKALNVTEDSKGCAGIDALGILKADVDNLGVIMSCGLKPERFTISRLASLSRQLNAFFACYLPYKLKENQRYGEVYTVFGGGDDLFLIGPWNVMLNLASELSDDFRRYCCGNPQIHLSAGIIFCKPNTPLDTMAEHAEEALELSKSGEKNKVTVFGETLPWLKVKSLFQVKDKIWKWYQDNIVTRSMLYKLNELIYMAAHEKEVLNQSEIFLKDMHCTKWRALLSYFTERNVAKSLPKDARSQIVNEVAASLAHWLETYGGWLKVPLWDILYNTR
ncbi:MAG: type III-A CRISPR-associated protein Cas10/Csm1 [Deltaproteobacteria bacterium]|nr:type III-A CRISPR-associated protein Cas10/Csm1 [Deltaproteobacteria bacterium]MBW1927837.1 type III-A CRISPR-associated protein Cas10/Csm1 [Deltaproteobacteria bacterium]MBW2026511.1 type III-A CRISPR-associated protein Cas10/Csm1 [Deltaproteobacteria bacterium]